MTTENTKPQRLLSLDELRGFDMFWIIGGSSLFSHLTRHTAWQWDNVIGKHMGHSGWEGFRFYDLIFPLFMFLAGVAIPYLFGTYERVVFFAALIAIEWFVLWVLYKKKIFLKV